ncbi:TPA: HD domain-containing protein [Burkholderia dolosa]
MSIAFKAMQFAREAHKDQVRKYTGNPYVDHLAEVAGIVATVAHEYLHLQHEMLAIAWLHDCVEDQNVTHDELVDRFGGIVADGVLQLSDLETGNRAERKAASRARLAAAWPLIQTIKCADLISNTSSIVKHDPKFAVTYLEEKRLLLDVLTKADPRLLQIARAQAA